MRPRYNKAGTCRKSLRLAAFVLLLVLLRCSLYAETAAQRPAQLLPAQLSTENLLQALLQTSTHILPPALPSDNLLAVSPFSFERDLLFGPPTPPDTGDIGGGAIGEVALSDGTWILLAMCLAYAFYNRKTKKINNKENNKQ
jgi:hypothetical protein